MKNEVMLAMFGIFLLLIGATFFIFPNDEKETQPILSITHTYTCTIENGQALQCHDMEQGDWKEGDTILIKINEKGRRNELRQ